MAMTRRLEREGIEWEVCHGEGRGRVGTERVYRDYLGGGSQWAHVCGRASRKRAKVGLLSGGGTFSAGVVECGQGVVKVAMATPPDPLLVSQSHLQPPKHKHQRYIRCRIPSEKHGELYLYAESYDIIKVKYAGLSVSNPLSSRFGHPGKCGPLSLGWPVPYKYIQRIIETTNKYKPGSRR